MDKEKKEMIFEGIGTALADIQKRADERRKVREAAAKDKEGKKTFKARRSEDTKLAGLATFGSTTTRKKTTK